MKISFITWYPSCRRSDALADALGGTSHLIHYLQFKQPIFAPPKYVMQTIATWRHLSQDKPRTVLVASPPVFAVLAVWVYCLVFGCRYIVDAHTGMFDDPRWIWLSPVSRFLARRAITNIVTNDYLQEQVESWGARAVIIGDLPLAFPVSKPIDLGSGVHVVVVNTFSQDEPLDEILKAAARLPAINFHVTGNLKHSRSNWTESHSNNIHFTGWLSETGYAGLLQSANIVMCLTKNDHTMQRGAYEAMALGKPLITSDWTLLRETFHEGTVHVDNAAENIVGAVQYVVGHYSELQSKMRHLAVERRSVFNSRLQALRDAFKGFED